MYEHIQLYVNYNSKVPEGTTTRITLKYFEALNLACNKFTRTAVHCTAVIYSLSIHFGPPLDFVFINITSPVLGVKYYFKKSYF